MHKATPSLNSPKTLTIPPSIGPGVPLNRTHFNPPTPDLQLIRSCVRAVRERPQHRPYACCRENWLCFFRTPPEDQFLLKLLILSTYCSRRPARIGFVLCTRPVPASQVPASTGDHQELTACRGPAIRATGSRNWAHPVFAYFARSAAVRREVRQNGEEEKRRGGSGANMPPVSPPFVPSPFTAHPLRRGSSFVGGGRKEPPTGGRLRRSVSTGVTSIPDVLHPPMAGFLLLPAMSRLLARVYRRRPKRPRRGSGPHVTPLP